MPPPPPNTIPFWIRVQRHIDPRRFWRWFLGVIIPFALLLSAFIQWHNSIVGEPGPIDLILRFVTALLLFSFGILLVWFKVLRPAIAEAKKE
jgi:hypothetical protein